jgi:ubiquinone/menaquinone biosynthesis C-methylase UbiE
MPTIAENLAVYCSPQAFPSDGGEWKNQAAYCGVHYELWKAELFDTFVTPFVACDMNVVEIAPGHGRWSCLLAPLVPQGCCILVDVSAACIQYCRTRLSTVDNVVYQVNDGATLPFLPNGSIDFIWSYDSFVHIEEPETRSYFSEFRRIMKPRSRGCIHHPGTPTPKQRREGWRSLVTAALVQQIVETSKLEIIRQTDTWGPKGICNTKLHADLITEFRKPL